MLLRNHRRTCCHGVTATQKDIRELGSRERPQARARRSFLVTLRISSEPCTHPSALLPPRLVFLHPFDGKIEMRAAASRGRSIFLFYLPWKGASGLRYVYLGRHDFARCSQFSNFFGRAFYALRDRVIVQVRRARSWLLFLRFSGIFLFFCANTKFL